MENGPRGIAQLLELLYGWQPYSAAFRERLSSLLAEQVVVPREVLCRLGAHVNAAWFSVDAWVLLWRPLENGEREVARIYRPGELFTEPGGFFGNGMAQGELAVLEGGLLLRLSRNNFAQLREFTETFDLAQRYMLIEREMQTWRLGLLALREANRVAAFASRFPIALLPAQVCASFLRMTASRFSAARAGYLRSRR